MCAATVRTVTCPPALAKRAMVPPVPKISSSGWGATTSIRRVSGISSTFRVRQLLGETVREIPVGCRDDGERPKDGDPRAPAYGNRRTPEQNGIAHRNRGDDLGMTHRPRRALIKIFAMRSPELDPPSDAPAVGHGRVGKIEERENHDRRPKPVRSRPKEQPACEISEWNTPYVAHEALCRGPVVDEKAGRRSL